MTSPILRFAPSPTGFLHVGNARTALLNWLYARSWGGEFRLRFDDTDVERSQAHYVQAIQEDLAWLGWTYDHMFFQSDRLDRYKEAADLLRHKGRLYPCYETPQDLNFKRKLQLSQGRPPVYDREALQLTASQKAELDSQGRLPHWRFLLTHDPIHWHDLAHGVLTIDPSAMSDPILIRENGSPVYTFCSVVDDLDTGTTHILRGNDHISNTAVQLQIFEALGGNKEKLYFAHFPLLVGEQGEMLSKRVGSLSLRSLREEGIEPMALTNYLAKIGTREEPNPKDTLESLVHGFDLKQYGRASPHFSETDLSRVNAKYVQHLTYEKVRPSLVLKKIPFITKEFWDAVSPNLMKLEDVGSLWQICTGPITPLLSEPEYLLVAHSYLPLDPWTEDTWEEWTRALKDHTGRKGKDLVMPLRGALTGQLHGPEMKKLLPFIGYEKACKRLQGKAI